MSSDFFSSTKAVRGVRHPEKTYASEMYRVLIEDKGVDQETILAEMDKIYMRKFSIYAVNCMIQRNLNHPDPMCRECAQELLEFGELKALSLEHTKIVNLWLYTNCINKKGEE